MRDRRGQILVWVMVVTGVLSLFAATLFFMIMHESRWSRGQKHTATAFQVGEAALARGYWKLQENTNYWADLASAPIAGYNDDVVYTDADHPTWRYRVKLTTTTDTTERKIIGTGIVLQPGTTVPVSARAIEAIYVKNTVVGAIHGTEVEIDDDVFIHWGPVLATKDLEMDLVKGTRWEYPRHLVTGGIEPWDEDPTPPNWDNFPGIHSTHGGKSGDAFAGAFHTFNDVPVPQPPELDMNYYAQKAKDEEVAEPGVTHYFTDANANMEKVRDDLGTPKGLSSLPMKDHYRFFENKVHIHKETFMRGYIIARGDIKLEGEGKGAYTAGLGGYDAPPVNAWKEYVVATVVNGTGPGDSAAISEYPADAGYQTVNPTFQFGAPKATALKDGVVDLVMFYGFVYGAGEETEIKLKRDSIVHGAINVHPKTEEMELESPGGKYATVYFRDNLEIRTSTSGIMRRSWREIMPTSFSYW